MLLESAVLPFPGADEMLDRGLAGIGLEVPPSVQATLLAYVALIAKWNRVYNLTAVRDPEEMLSLHVLDSLAIVPALQRHVRDAALSAPRLLDVGSGAGLPGVVLAAVVPELTVTCVDTVGKKASFIRQAAAELGLRNLCGEHARVEQMRIEPVDVVTSRAFASLRDFTQLTRQHLRPGGVWLAMKGKTPSSEMAELATDVTVFHVEPIQVPGLDAERCLVWMRPQSTPATC